MNSQNAFLFSLMCLLAVVTTATGATIDTPLSSDFFVITTTGTGDATDSTTSFDDSNGSVLGIDLGSGTGDANIAITNVVDQSNFSGTTVFADPSIGIQVAGPSSSVSSSNATFNGGPLSSGVTGGVDPTALLNELAAIRASINGLAATDTLDLDEGSFGAASFTGGSSASVSGTSSDITINLAPGLNVIDIDTNGDDIDLNNATLTIDGPAGSTVVFRFDGPNFLVSSGDIVTGPSGIGEDDVLFFTDQDSSDTIFQFSNTTIEAAAFFSLGDGGGTIDVSNGSGSAQFVADTVTFSNVSFDRAAFGGFAAVPEPTTGLLAAIAGLGLVSRRRRTA